MANELFVIAIVVALCVVVAMLATSCGLYEAVVGGVDQGTATMGAIQLAVEKAAQELDGIGKAIQQGEQTLEALERVGAALEWLMIMVGTVIIGGSAKPVTALGKRLLNGKKPPAAPP